MVFDNEHLIALGVGMLLLGSLVLFLFILFVFIYNKKSKGIPSSKGCFSTDGLDKWIEFNKNAGTGKSDDEMKKTYKTFCKNPTNDNWIKTFGVQGDPHTNGFYDFSRDCPKCPKHKCPTHKCRTQKCPTCPCACDSPNNFINSGGNINDFNNKCCDSSTTSLRTGSKNQDPNGYNDYCVKNTGIQRTSEINCPTCTYSNAEWMNINDLDELDADKNGYNDFCIKSSGSTSDWFDKVVPLLPPLSKGTNGNDPKINGYNKFCGK